VLDQAQFQRGVRDTRFSASVIKRADIFPGSSSQTLAPMAPHTDLLVLVELPAVGVNTNIKFNVKSTNLDRIAGVLSDCLSDLVNELEDDLLLTDSEGSDLMIEHLRKSAAAQLSAWEQRLVEASETKAKGERAVQHLKTMREAYYKELSHCREQLHLKHRAEEKGEDFKPSNVVHFDPTEYIADDEMSELLRQKIAIMQPEHDAVVHDLTVRNADLVEQVKTKGMHLSAKDKYLAQVIDDRSKEDRFTPSSDFTRADTCMSIEVFSQASMESLPSPTVTSPTIPATRVRTKVADMGVNTETQETRSTATQSDVDGTLLDKAAELFEKKTESTWQHLLAGDSDSDDESDGGGVSHEQKVISGLPSGEDIGCQQEEYESSNSSSPTRDAQRKGAVTNVVQLFLDEAMAVRRALRDASTQVGDDLIQPIAAEEEAERHQEAEGEVDSSLEQDRPSDTRGGVESAEVHGARAGKMSVEQILMRRHVLCSGEQIQQGSPMAVTCPKGPKPAGHRPVSRVETSPLPVTSGEGNHEFERPEYRAAASLPTGDRVTQESEETRRHSTGGRRPSLLGVPMSRRTSANQVPSRSASPRPGSASISSSMAPSPASSRSASPCPTFPPSGKTLPPVDRKKGVSCINFGDLTVKGATPPEDDGAAVEVKTARTPTHSRRSQDLAPKVFITPDMSPSPRRHSDGASVTRSSRQHSKAGRGVCKGRVTVGSVDSEEFEQERDSWTDCKGDVGIASRPASRSMDLPNMDSERHKARISSRSMDLPDSCCVSMRIASKEGATTFKGKQTLPPLRSGSGANQ